MALSLQLGGDEMARLKSKATLDWFRLICAFLIIAIHTSPLFSFSETADFMLTRIFARVAVPFFFMTTGYFAYSKLNQASIDFLKSFCKKTALLYTLGIGLYLPLNMYAGYFKDLTPVGLLKDIVLDGTFYHLWYLPGVLLGMVIVWLLLKHTGMFYSVLICLFLYVIGLFGDSYYGLGLHIPILKSFYDLIFQVSDYTRNGIFFAPIFLVLGAQIGSRKKLIPLNRNIRALTIAIPLFVIEALALHFFGMMRHDSMYILLLPVMYFGFILLIHFNSSTNKSVRAISTTMYFIHPWMIVVVRGIAKVLSLEARLINNSLFHFLGVALLTYIFASTFVHLWKRYKKGKSHPRLRAWVEIDLNALKNNVKTLSSLLKNDSDLIAVVKANAYGHGAITIAQACNSMGIKHFATATLSEGVELRKNKIEGEILILGYTPPADAKLLVKHHLTQTVLSYDYAKALNQTKTKIKVHVKVDTGMHRLGIEADKEDLFEKLFAMPYLSIKGMFTHLGSAEGEQAADIAFTKLQTQRFFKLVHFLESKGYSPGKIHVQSSYGLFNHPDITCDYVRTGLALYGIFSNLSKTKPFIGIEPVLSLKAKVAMVREISADESVGYDRFYTATTKRTIATVTIGYADGVPRNLSQNKGRALIRGHSVPIIGKICMDQLIIDVTGIEDVEMDDTVTIIGKDHLEEIRCEELAEKCDTITNEILTCLGSRLTYLTTNKL
jgi:serine/alanine racemase